MKDMQLTCKMSVDAVEVRDVGGLGIDRLHGGTSRGGHKHLRQVNMPMMIKGEGAC